MSDTSDRIIMEELGRALVGHYAWRSPAAKLRVVNAIVDTLADLVIDAQGGAPTFGIFAEPAPEQLRELTKAAVEAVVVAAVAHGDLIPMVQA